MGIANKVAGALGSLIFGAILLSGIGAMKEKFATVSPDEKIDLLNAMADKVVMPYIVMAVVLGLLAVLIRKAPLPHVEAEPIDDTELGETAKTSIFQSLPVSRLQVSRGSPLSSLSMNQPVTSITAATSRHLFLVTSWPSHCDCWQFRRMHCQQPPAAALYRQ